MSEQQEFCKLLCLHFTYDPLTGIVYHRPREIDPSRRTSRQKTWNTKNANKPAGSNNCGYIRISLLGFEIYAHQVAFALMTGEIPLEVDHENLNKSDNRWENLRDANRGSNSRNVEQRKRNKLKIKGVSWSKSNNCFRMDISFNNKKYHSYHATPEGAYSAYCLKSAELHGKFGNVT